MSLQPPAAVPIRAGTGGVSETAPVRGFLPV